MTAIAITPQIVRHLIQVVDKGLTEGMGEPVPGAMCVEAAVCFAFGEPHGDAPRCVRWNVAALKITLNDYSEWGTRLARAKGLRRLAVAQLGSIDIDVRAFDQRLAVLSRGYRQRFRLADRSSAFYGEPFPLETTLNDTLHHLKGSRPKQVRVLSLVCEDIVQLLLELKVPGTKFLNLVGGQARPTHLRWKPMRKA